MIFEVGQCHINHFQRISFFPLGRIEILNDLGTLSNIEAHHWSKRKRKNYIQLIFFIEIQNKA